MRNSLIQKKQLPESWEDFHQLVTQGGVTFRSCMSCVKPFSRDNTITEAGWRETQISGVCENCFDNAFDEGI